MKCIKHELILVSNIVLEPRGVEMLHQRLHADNGVYRMFGEMETLFSYVGNGAQLESNLV